MRNNGDNNGDNNRGLVNGDNAHLLRAIAFKPNYKMTDKGQMTAAEVCKQLDADWELLSLVTVGDQPTLQDFMARQQLYNGLRRSGRFR